MVYEDPHLRLLREELERQGRAANTADKERADAFTALMKHPGWKVYTDLLTSKVEEMGGIVMGPSGGLDGAIAMEHAKGVMAGVLLCRDLPRLIVEQMKQLTDQESGT